MAKILFTWELGAGLGHIIPIRDIARVLIENGHEVSVSLRNLDKAEAMFGDMSVEILPAPFKSGAAHNRVAPMVTMAHIVNNVSFCAVDELAGRVTAWRNLFNYVKPDVIVFDHSPTALLASRGLDVKRALLGTGFYYPTHETPWPSFRPRAQVEPEKLLEYEHGVLKRANAVMEKFSQPTFDSLADIFGQADRMFLRSIPELDPYGPREDKSIYYGVWAERNGPAPDWPEGKGPRIYGYLKPFKTLGTLLNLIKVSTCPAVIYVSGVRQDFQKQFATKSLTFSNEPLDILAARDECDMAILNGTHATTALMLSAGKQALHAPFMIEQELNARIVERQEMGVCASPNDPMHMSKSFNTLLDKVMRQVSASGGTRTPAPPLGEGYKDIAKGIMAMA